MSQAGPRHNHDGSGARGRLVRWAVGAAWALTMALVVRSEVLAHRESEDVRRLVDSARLTRQHASARYLVRTDEVLGTLSSTVSGSREEEQLAYILEGEIHAPVRVRLKGVVVAGWDRRPSRFAFDVDVAGSRHRLDSARGGDGRFRVRYVDPSGDVARTWLLDDLPTLAPGPLPVPATDPSALAHEMSGSVPSPGGGAPVGWTLSAPAPCTVAVAGEARSAVRRELQAGPATLVVYTEPDGFPLRLDLPGGVVIELAEEGR